MSISYGQPVDIYCERLDASFWSEPINAITNLAFIIAAILAFKLWKTTSPNDRPVKALILICALVGIGSFLFHTLATTTAVYFDIIPIAIFIHYTVFLVFHRVFNMKWWWSIIGVFAFVGFSMLIISYFGRATFNGSMQYVPAFLLLLFISIICYWKKFSPAKEFLIAAFTFLISITCRSVDASICESFPLGTHFLWHTLNGVTMYYVMKGIINSRESRV